jgi:predicted nucleic acid-binding protein
MTSVYLLDTNAVSDAMMDHPKLKARMAGQSAGLITSVIVCGRFATDLNACLRESAGVI